MRLGILLLTFLWRPAWCAAPVLKVGLAESEKAALANSSTLKAVDAELSAARARADGRWSRLWPRLTAEANWRYLSEVPALTVAGRTQRLGDNESYSIGPSLGWTLWDQGEVRESWKSALAASRAKGHERKDLERQVLLRTRVAYFQAQLALEQVRLLADSLRLAQTQHKDIDNRRKAGASSFIDSLSAHQDVLSRARLFRQARTELAEALRDLFALTGTEPQAELSLPLDSDSAAQPPEGTEPASAAVSLDPLEEAMTALSPAAAAAFDETHPALRRLAETAESWERSARSARAGLWPRLYLTARTSLDYPNGPVLESYHQNMVGVAAGLPLFESGRTRQEAEEGEFLAQAARSRMDQARQDRLRDRHKAQDRLLGLQAQRELDRVSVKETKDLSTRIYDSYIAGRSTFIEVQGANLRELEARVGAVRTDAQTLMQLAVLAELSGKE
ncbi:MAG: hypothetical protein A2X36_11015 [Elusimicrobia bacterium GWA2_69_24]|nr:MAG: hypothetical protein A2X36_11015 [Elusimicrobia bacterium GWA2_69_24]